MSHSCPNLVSTSFLYNPYIPFLICRNFLFTIYYYLRYNYVLLLVGVYTIAVSGTNGVAAAELAFLAAI